jgi:hypothetical protein
VSLLTRVGLSALRRSIGMHGCVYLFAGALSSLRACVYAANGCGRGMGRTHTQVFLLDSHLSHHQQGEAGMQEASQQREGHVKAGMLTSLGDLACVCACVLSAQHCGQQIDSSSIPAAICFAFGVHDAFDSDVDAAPRCCRCFLLLGGRQCVLPPTVLAGPDAQARLPGHPHAR